MFAIFLGCMQKPNYFLFFVPINQAEQLFITILNIPFV